MKVTLAVLMILVVITFTQTPNPIPLPSLNLNKVQGLWYVVALYQKYISMDYDCVVWNIRVLNATTINMTLTAESKGYLFNETSLWNVSNNGSVWNEKDWSAAWISFDPLNGTWGTFAFYDNQMAFILSRSPSLNASIIVSQLPLLQSEGYYATLFNTYFLPNNCTMGVSI